MRRGFKAEAERLADRTRSDMGLTPTTPVDVRVLAHHLNIEVVPADQLIDIRKLQELIAEQDGAFSAASFHLPDDRVVIVCNPLNDPARTNSDIAHEIAHILLRHDVRELQTIGGNVFFTCDPDQEEEANWLAGCLLLPRQILLREAFANASADHIAAKYQVSAQMARFRLNTSCVNLQVRRAQQSRSRRPRA
ncbi:ImmA/IrrE family metallo-endopeptidase [Actinomadura sp. WMMA1423]|uniref:ImmA/IrrE family metallo-endopeptidase n=1 Tax=Actinomadura sp. WMMA1423 TaxID=2591108 RepID=UPI0011467334|nr:ImmA/IrrE family metallo-endopeptidase [Actinomadura sp. WMMA1423]